MGTLAEVVCGVAGDLCMNPHVEADGDDCVRLGEFTIERGEGVLSVYRLRDIPGGQHADPVCAGIPCDAVNAEARAAIALLRAWVNQSLDFAELAATQPEE